MQNYAPGTAVTVMIDLRAEDGSELVPLSARWRVLDEGDAEVLAWANFATPPVGASTAVEVPSGVNTLGAGVTKGIRRVEVEIVDERGTYLLSEVYLLKAATALVLYENTFLTHSQALLLADEFAGRYVAAWTTEPSRDEQEAALLQAHARIRKQPIRLEFDDDQSRITYTPWGKTRFEDITAQQVADLDPKLLKALKRAQLIEAAFVLTEDGVNAARNDGLMSMTVGESSQFFRPSKPLDRGICKEAAAELARWIDRRVKLARG